MSKIVESLYRVSGIESNENCYIQESCSLDEAVSINDNLDIVLPKGTIVDVKHNNCEYDIDNKIFIGSIPIKSLKGEYYFLKRIKDLIKNSKAVRSNMYSFTWSRLLDPELINYIEVEWGENNHLPLGTFIGQKREFLESSGYTPVCKEFESEFIDKDYKSLEYNPFLGLIRIYFHGEGLYDVDDRISSEDLFNQIINFLNTYDIKYKTIKKQLYGGESEVIDIKVNPKVFFREPDIEKL